MEKENNAKGNECVKRRRRNKKKRMIKVGKRDEGEREGRDEGIKWRKKGI